MKITVSRHTASFFATGGVNVIELRKIVISDAANYDNIARECISLEIASEQNGFCASNADSLEEAYNNAQEGYIDVPYAIYDSNVMVGFIMYGFVKKEDDIYGEDCYNLWRIMVDKNHQGKGYAKQTVIKVIEEIKTRPYGEATHIYTSYKPTNIASKKLFASLGFLETGAMDDDESIARLRI